MLGAANVTSRVPVASLKDSRERLLVVGLRSAIPNGLLYRSPALLHSINLVRLECNLSGPFTVLRQL